MKHIKTYNESITHLLKPKSEEDIKKETSNLSADEKMRYACKYGLGWLAQEALNEKFSIYRIGYYLGDAIANGHAEIFKVLIKNYMPTDLLNDYISQIIKHNQLEILKILVDYGCDIKNSDDFEYEDMYVTYLELSVLKYSPEIIKYLIDNGASQYIQRDILIDLLKKDKYDIINILIDNIKGIKDVYKSLYNEYKERLKKLEKIL